MAHMLRAYTHSHTYGSVFNTNGAFELVTDVSSSRKGLRSGGTDDLATAGELLLKDLSWKKKETYDYEALLLPRGPEFDDDYKWNASENAVSISSYSLDGLEAVHLHLRREARRYTDAVSAKTEKKFQFNWLGKSSESQRSLHRALRCKKFQYSPPDRVAAYLKELDAKIKEFKAAASAA